MLRHWPTTDNWPPGHHTLSFLVGSETERLDLFEKMEAQGYEPIGNHPSFAHDGLRHYLFKPRLSRSSRAGLVTAHSWLLHVWRKAEERNTPEHKAHTRPLSPPTSSRCAEVSRP